MTHHRPTSRPASRAQRRRSLHREVPATLGVLADPRDFTAMRRYRTFAFEDHDAYLSEVQQVMNTLAARHLHTTLALFDPEEYAQYCTREGMDPDDPASRSRFTARAARSGATVACDGAPLTALLPRLIDRSVRHATWNYATLLLADAGPCEHCGEDLGRSAFDLASAALMALLEAAGEGSHHLVCSVPAPDEQLLAVVHAEAAATGTAVVDADAAAEFTTVLAAGLALRGSGGIVLRTSRPGAPDRLHGWRLDRGRLTPLTAAEVFDAYCTDAVTGEPVPPEPGVEYCAGRPLPEPGGHH
ncbi:hypothetical protein ABZ705_21145 [Streptomyces sp. NPDC006984]|uniref:hypothetical protein n=1 Tax=Streptomyces sp. NPDC006984 TaxID=3155463 RepID=UPI00340E69CD